MGAHPPRLNRAVGDVVTGGPQPEHQTARWAHVDAHGHLSNVVHLSFFDCAVSAWLMGASGLGVRHLSSTGMVVETSCRHVAELYLPGTVTSGLRLECFGRTNVASSLALFPEGAEELVAVGRFVNVCVDREHPLPGARHCRRCWTPSPPSVDWSTGTCGTPAGPSCSSGWVVPGRRGRRGTCSGLPAVRARGGADPASARRARRGASRSVAVARGAA